VSAPAGISAIQAKILQGETLTPEERDIAAAHSLYAPEPEGPEASPENLAALRGKIQAEGFGALSPAEGELALRALGEAPSRPPERDVAPAPAVDPSAPVSQGQLVAFRDGLTDWVVEELTPRMTRLVERMDAFEENMASLTALDARLKVLEQSSTAEQASEWAETFNRHAEQTKMLLDEQHASIVKTVDKGLQDVDEAYRERHDALSKRVDDLGELTQGLEVAKADRAELPKASSAKGKTGT